MNIEYQPDQLGLNHLPFIYRTSEQMVSFYRSALEIDQIQTLSALHQIAESLSNTNPLDLTLDQILDFNRTKAYVETTIKDVGVLYFITLLDEEILRMINKAPHHTPIIGHHLYHTIKFGL